MRKTAFALFAALSLAGCVEDEYIYVDRGWVRLPAVTGGAAAAYFTVHGGPRDDTLIRVSAPTAIRSELHETMRGDNMASMRPVRSIPVPAKSEVRFEPGGKHVMLFNLRTTRPGQTVRLDFTFASGYQLYIDAVAQAAGAPAPASD